MEPRARPAATRGQQLCPDTASTTGKTGTKTGAEHEDHNTPNKRKHLKSVVLGRQGGTAVIDRFHWVLEINPQPGRRLDVIVNPAGLKD